MTLLRDDGLADRVLAGYVIEPAGPTDLDDLSGIVAAELTEAFGFCPYTNEDVRSDLELPEGSVSLQRLVRDRTNGTAVQWWAAVLLPGDPTVHAWVRSHPSVAGPRGDELTRLGWTTLLDWVARVAPEGREEVEVRSGTPANGDVGRRRLAAAGFVHERTFWEMTGAVDQQAVRQQPSVEGLTIVPTKDERTLHRVLVEGFRGHWGYQPLPFDDWEAVERAASGYDPTLRRLALIDGTPAAAMVMSRRAVSEGALYVAELATLAPYRRRGIASALLAHAFQVAAAEGLAQVSLHVDSENEHDAPSVYQHAGLRVRTAFHAFTRSVATEPRVTRTGR